MRPVLFCLAAVLGLAACGDDRTPLLVYSPHGKEMLRAYEEAFEAERPDVDVQWIDLGSQEAYDRVRVEQQNPQASVWWGAPQTLFAQAADEGLLQPFEPSWAAAVPADAKDAGGRWYGTYLTPEGVLYNTAAVDSAAVPATWDDLLDPQWRDRLLIRSPLASGTMRTIWAAMILRQPTVEDGYRWLARLDQNTKGYAADPTQLYLRIARGEADLTLWNLPDTYLQAQSYPFAFSAPAPAVPVLVDGVAIPKGAPQPDLAREFVEFVTTPDALVRQAQEFGRIPARTDIAQDRLPAWMAAQIYTPMDLDWERIAAEGAGWMQVWDERIKGRGAEYLAETGGA
ncbi:extracellular solute-binding protein [Rubrivirga sp. S365]|uniref:Extracellular solute-binding protein n=1 Tax=Rubrivirga litoralis TaxID=3075598 RepID=A0ABU3BNY9_9BACT|nr:MULTISPECIES: extracellular solute-binding protein [unclassified Rubrivirga]MDT0631006.1 extracellular solute-binding protein [Rubrivirga sp. F394]MDT7855032.1 extracellular solute-binding protein [Rubrivirga sp. S365]